MYACPRAILIIIIIYGYNKWGTYKIIISISAGPTKESWMKEQKLMIELRKIVKCFLYLVWTSPLARRRVSRAHKHLCVLRTKDGARVSIIFNRWRRLYACSASWPLLESMRLENIIFIYLLIVI